MEILMIQYEGYSKEDNQLASCTILLQEKLFTIAYLYKISVEEGFPICSDLEVTLLTTESLEILNKEFLRLFNADFIELYEFAKIEGYKIICGIDPLQRHNPYLKTPRFSECDFENIIKEAGGHKIPESEIKSPDFILNDVVLELKDIQEEGLLNGDRQKSIVNIFKGFENDLIDLDPMLDYGDYTRAYHGLIKNTIEGHFQKASAQIKSYKKSNAVDAAGVILLNTGMFSLPHDMLKSIVKNILNNRKTIEFVFILSQKMQSNGFDAISVFPVDFIGRVPETINELIRKGVNDLIDRKMTEMVLGYGMTKDIHIESQHPISFQLENKIFYWNPGMIKDSRLT